MFRYVPRVIPTNIFVIGCGGTGSRLVPLLSQFMKTVTAGANPRGTVVDPVIYLIDDDSVETKNLQRQNFIPADVGKNKAEVLAQRYGRAYGVNIVPVVRRVVAGVAGRRHPLFSDIEVEPQQPGENSLVIMCVDSAQARRDIIAAWSPDRMPATSRSVRPEIAPVFIDAGNEDDFGQVRIFQRAVIGDISTHIEERIRADLPTMRPEIANIHCLPMDTRFYERLQDNPGGSCADLDQTLAINALMATLIMGMVQNLYYLKPFTYHSMGISLSGGVSVEHLTAEYMLGLSRDYSEVRRQFGDTPFAFDGVGVLQDYADENALMLSTMGLTRAGRPIVVDVPVQAADVAEMPSGVMEETSEEGSPEGAESSDTWEEVPASAPSLQPRWPHPLGARPDLSELPGAADFDGDTATDTTPAGPEGMQGSSGLVFGDRLVSYLGHPVTNGIPTALTQDVQAAVEEWVTETIRLRRGAPTGRWSPTGAATSATPSTAPSDGTGIVRSDGPPPLRMGLATVLPRVQEAAEGSDDLSADNDGMALRE